MKIEEFSPFSQFMKWFKISILKKKALELFTFPIGLQAFSFSHLRILELFEVKQSISNISGPTYTMYTIPMHYETTYMHASYVT